MQDLKYSTCETNITRSACLGAVVCVMLLCKQSMCVCVTSSCHVISLGYHVTGLCLKRGSEFDGVVWVIGYVKGRGRMKVGMIFFGTQSCVLFDNLFVSLFVTLFDNLFVNLFVTLFVTLFVCLSVKRAW